MTDAQPPDLPELRDFIRGRRAALYGFMANGAALELDGDVLRIIPRGDIYIRYLNDNCAAIAALATEFYRRPIEAQCGPSGAARSNGNGKKPGQEPHHQETDHKQSAEGKGRRYSKDDLYDRLKTEIEANPERAYNQILGAKLTLKAGSREPVTLCPFHEDSNPSFSVNLEKAVWFCHPCGRGGDAFGLAKELWNLDFKAVIPRLAELLLSGGNHQAEEKDDAPKEIVRTLRYEIRDLDGDVKAVHVREEHDDGSKNMWWERPGGERGLGGLPVTDLPLYGISRTIDSADGEVVVVCEGEKATDVLWERGILSVGTVTGAASMPCDGSLKPLLRFKTCLWSDNDPKGHGHMEGIGRCLIELGAREVFKIIWKDAPPKGDAADFEGDLQALVDSAEPFEDDEYADRHAIDAFDAYQNMVGEHREYSVEEMIRDGCSAVVSALIGSGKTTLAMNLARAWGLGLLFLGRVCRQSRTLVVVSPKEYEAWADAIGFWKLKGLVFLAESTKAHFGDPAKTVRWFDSEMRRFDCRTFILDTLFDFFGMPPNLAGDANRIIMNEQAPFLQMARERVYSGLVTGHAPKSEAQAVVPRDPEEAFAGNTAWTAQHRMRITIRRKSQGVNAIVTGRGGYGDRGILKEELLLFNEETRLVSLGGLFSDHLGEAALPGVIDAMRDYGGPISMPKLIEQMGKGEKWVRAGVKAGRNTKPEPSIETNAVKGKRDAKYWLPGQNPDDSTLL